VVDGAGAQLLPILLPAEREGWPMKLSGPDHVVWLALRRVNGGGVATHKGSYYHRGHPIGLLLTEVLGALLDDGLLSQADPSAVDGLSRISLTEEGAARYAALCRQQRSSART
jgi:hypothetical protein